MRRLVHDRMLNALPVRRPMRSWSAAASPPHRLGHRPDGPLGHVPGAIDQALDSVEILTRPNRRHDYAPMLGLRA